MLIPKTGLAREIIEIDQTAPTVIYIQKSDTVEANKPLEISVEATDNQKVARVTLFFRRKGEAEYQSAELVNTDRDHYAYVISGEEIYGERIEYYIAAEDEAGNRTMKGYSITPYFFTVTPSVSGLSKKSGSRLISSRAAPNAPDSASTSYSKVALEAIFGESMFRLSDQGNQLNVPSMVYGMEVQFQYTKGYELDLGISATHTDSIKMNWIPYQNLGGTLYESLDTLSVYGGERFRQKQTSFLVGLNYLSARLNDRNLLNAAGFRIARLPDENYSQTGLLLGFGWQYRANRHLFFGIDPKLILFLTGQLNHFIFPAEGRYEF